MQGFIQGRLAVCAMALAGIVLACGVARADNGFTANCDQLTSTGLSGVAPNVLQLANGTLRMYFMGNGMQSAVSTDGVTWTTDSGSRLQPTPGDTVTFFSNPWVFATLDGRYRMIYEGSDGTNRRLYSAISSDSLNFTKESLVMAGSSIDMGGSGMFLSVPAGVRLSDNRLRMYYVSDGADTRSAVSSDDGRTWTPDGGTALYQAVDPMVYGSGSKYTMLYTDWNKSSRTKNILYASSSDGINFTPTGEVLASVTNNAYSLVDSESLDVGGLRRVWFSLMTNSTGANANPIYTCLLPQAFAVSGSQSGAIGARSLTLRITPSSADYGKQGNFYLAASVGGTVFVNNGSQWLLYTGGAIPVYAQGKLLPRTLSVLTNADANGLAGASVIGGYGVSDADLLSGKYAAYTISP